MTFTVSTVYAVLVTGAVLTAILATYLSDTRQSFKEVLSFPMIWILAAVLVIGYLFIYVVNGEPPRVFVSAMSLLYMVGSVCLVIIVFMETVSLRKTVATLPVLILPLCIVLYVYNQGFDRQTVSVWFVGNVELKESKEIKRDTTPNNELFKYGFIER